MFKFFAESNQTELVLVLGAFATMLGGFWAVMRLMLNQGAKDRDEDRHERQQLVNALKDVADSNREIAIQTKKGADEAKQRNGHLADLVLQSKTDIQDYIQNVHEQYVDKQVVKKQEVNK